MGNEASTQKSRTEEAALRTAAASGDAAAVEAMLKQTPGLVYAHTKAGENLWHLAAESGHTEVRCCAHPAYACVLCKEGPAAVSI
jgi:ankyrin repeat protein